MWLKIASNDQSPILWWVCVDYLYKLNSEECVAVAQIIIQD